MKQYITNRSGGEIEQKTDNLEVESLISDANDKKKKFLNNKIPMTSVNIRTAKIFLKSVYNNIVSVYIFQR